jgi:putative transposase
MRKLSPFRYFKTSPEVIRLTVMLYIRYRLWPAVGRGSAGRRGIDICHETVRFGWNRLGPMFAAAIPQSLGNIHWNLCDL